MHRVLRSSFFAALLLGIAMAQSTLATASSDDTKPKLQPEVAALLKQSTDVYKKMKSYSHSSSWTISIKGAEGVISENVKFTLALERPNRFAYKMDSASKIFPPHAAYSDGMTFINFRGKTNQYMKLKAPVNYKGINIVDDVEFTPLGTYAIALMLQGDILADKDFRTALEKASMKPSVTENGKKYQVMEVPFGAEEENPHEFYFSAETHMLVKTTQSGANRSGETIENVKVDKQIDESVFKYKLPAEAKAVDQFTSQQRPTDAYNYMASPVRFAFR